MAEEEEPQRGLRAFMGFVAQWQVLLAVAVGASGLLFNFNEQRRTELALNRDAVGTARSDVVRAEFRRDPQNTLAEFQATFPEHAYCAALGFFVAEGGRLNREAPGRPDEALKDVNDALLARIEAQAGAVGVGADSFADELAAAVAAAAPNGDNAPCAGLPRLLGRGVLHKPECRLVVATYLLNQCNLKRDANRLAAEVRAEQVVAAAKWPVPEDGAPVRAPGPDTSGPDRSLSNSLVLGPDAACGGASPLIYPQFTTAADAPKVEGLRARMLAAGWQLADADLVEEGRPTDGDVRIYWETQRPCAERLAAAVGALPEVERPIQVISLADRYRGLPANQMELWLPPLD